MELDRKILADIATNDSAGFVALCRKTPSAPNTKAWHKLNHKRTQGYTKELELPRITSSCSFCPLWLDVLLWLIFSGPRVQSLPCFHADRFQDRRTGCRRGCFRSLPTELLSWAEPPRTSAPGRPILLNSNENAYGPLPRVLAMKNPFRTPTAILIAAMTTDRTHCRHARRKSRSGDAGLWIDRDPQDGRQRVYRPRQKAGDGCPTFEAIEFYAKAATLK